MRDVLCLFYGAPTVYFVVHTLRARRLVHLTRGLNLAEAATAFADPDLRDWLDDHAADGERRYPFDRDDPRLLRHIEWQKHKYPLEKLVLDQLRSGELVAFGFQQPIAADDKRQAVARDLWEFLTPDFYNSSAQGEGITIVRIEIIEAPLPGSIPYVPRADRKPEQLVQLTESSAMLRINDERYLFRGIVHRRVIRQLYEAFVAGSPELTQVLLNKAGVGSSSIATVFRGYPEWELLRRHIQTKYAFTWLEPRFY